MIESAANAKFKRIQKLMKQARARKKEGGFVVEGWKSSPTEQRKTGKNRESTRQNKSNQGRKIPCRKGENNA